MEREAPGLAAYQRVAEAIKSDIRTGVLSPGDRLPGNRGVADQYDVALGTAQKALGVLQDEGWLTSTPSVGVFVNGVADAAPSSDLHEIVARLQTTVADLVARVEAIEKR
ncbi:GntR family transcriptional regulator [Allosaccharopolyspora coralli]|uniref:GntR family transcriptional regulator n=1 Tax=Allosaccharopolyspora coralli TaxID=2665642 RepID=A0A5Q3Q9G5_9PSEU|nr:GntR family transcriptional regulator [Allosaccharopolyspora coralli]QGK71198.1 GntR family transcriptional regulator [Allosaccharopolyspora coralli]